ncbi:MAG: uridine kinase [Mycobacteriales bacterium]
MSREHRVRVLIDGVGSGPLADLVGAAITRQVVRVSAADFLRPAGERFEWGRQDHQAFRERWLDDGALRREVLEADAVLPKLWDAERDRSARASPVPLSAQAVVVVDGVLLLGRDLPADLTVHLATSPTALARQGVPVWQLPAFSAYHDQVRPGEVCDVLVRAEDPARPAVRWR